jgi:purine-binding chemotaxis protein CheW
VVSAARAARAAEHEYVTFRVATEWLGVPVGSVQEVLSAQRIAAVPKAPPDIAGFLNLRGQIVTAIDLRSRLTLPTRTADEPVLNVVIRDGEELFSFLVDEVGDVLSVAAEALEPPPATLAPEWKTFCDAIVRRERGLLVVVNATALLRLDGAASHSSKR